LIDALNIVTERPYDADYARVKVQHWIPDLRSGDTIIWNPKMNAHSLARYHVIATWPHYARKGVSFAELGRLIPDVTIAGETYRAPSQGFLMPMERMETVGNYLV
jgi:hypothetical protein